MICATAKKRCWRSTDKVKPKFSEGNHAQICLQKSLYLFLILTNNEVARQFHKTPKFNKNPFGILGLLHIGRKIREKLWKNYHCDGSSNKLIKYVHLNLKYITILTTICAEKPQHAKRTQL